MSTFFAGANQLHQFHRTKSVSIEIESRMNVSNGEFAINAAIRSEDRRRCATIPTEDTSEARLKMLLSVDRNCVRPRASCHPEWH